RQGRDRSAEQNRRDRARGAETQAQIAGSCCGANPDRDVRRDRCRRAGGALCRRAPADRIATGLARTARQGVGAMTSHLAKARRIVVKVGSSLLVDSAAATIKRDWLA